MRHLIIGTMFGILALAVDGSPARAEAVKVIPYQPAGFVSVELRAAENDVVRYTEIPWSPGMTAFDATKLAMTFIKMSLTAEWSVGGEWFVTALSTLGDEGTAPGSKNWMRCGSQSKDSAGYASNILKPGDRVTWVYSANFPPDCG